MRRTNLANNTKLNFNLEYYPIIAIRKMPFVAGISMLHNLYIGSAFKMNCNINYVSLFDILVKIFRKISHSWFFFFKNKFCISNIFFLMPVMNMASLLRGCLLIYNFCIFIHLNLFLKYKFYLFLTSVKTSLT